MVTNPLRTQQITYRARWFVGYPKCSNSAARPKSATAPPMTSRDRHTKPVSSRPDTMVIMSVVLLERS